ncbi:OTU domain-containing protein 4 isoform X3 [Hippocampus zosterae]|uniref:OTU domain-containing protein 4 isoform X3 n=1 Tax=Hippocampus zosterae TaxID=109293 RepID=UPI00223E4C3A|nr:OTU domain-containing protein 4 isoform X3 [Hippocampus zosterae]
MRANEEEALMDDYLATVGLHRKRVAKDGSCLFRAVAEQVLHCQSIHAQVRAQCIRFLRQHREIYEAFIEGDFEAYLQRLQDPQQWAGEVEMNALAIMFKRDFVIFQELGKSPVDITGNKFKEKVQLSFLNGNHYDSVYPISRIKNAALCQSILYELLYADVFQVSRQTVASYQSSGRAGERLSDDNMAPCVSSDDSDTGNSFRSNGSRTRGRGSGLVLPESVRRSLSESLYRNVAYDVWHKSKKAQLKRDYCMAAGMQYTVGQQCQVWLDETEKSYNATIEEVPPGDGLVRVYTEEEGQLRVPMWSLRPVTSESPGWSAAVRWEGRLGNGQQGRGLLCLPEGPRGKSSSIPRGSASSPRGRARLKKSRLPHEEPRRHRRSAPDTLSFGLTEEERLFKEEALKNVALVELHLRDELSFPALGKCATGPLQSTDASPSMGAAVSSSKSPSPAPACVPAPTFIAPIAPSPGAARAFSPHLSSPGPPVYPNSLSPSPGLPHPQVTDALRLSAPRSIKCPDAGDAQSVSALHNQGDATMDQRSAQVLKDQVADVCTKAWDPPRSQNQVQLEPPSSPLINPTLQNPSVNLPAHKALPVPSSGSPQLLSAAPLPLGPSPPTLPGGILVHHLYQDPLYPGFPQGENGNVLPSPEFSLRSSGEDLPQDINVLRFFFNLGVKAYTWPFYMPYLYLLPLQQAHIMQPRIHPPHIPPDGPLQPACPTGAVATQPGEPAKGYDDTWPTPHGQSYQASPGQRHPTEGSGAQSPQCAVLPSYPPDPHGSLPHRGFLQAFPANAALAYNMGEEGMNAMPRPDITPALNSPFGSHPCGRSRGASSSSPVSGLQHRRGRRVIWFAASAEQKLRGTAARRARRLQEAAWTRNWQLLLMHSTQQRCLNCSLSLVVSLSYPPGDVAGSACGDDAC